MDLVLRCQIHTSFTGHRIRLCRSAAACAKIWSPVQPRGMTRGRACQSNLPNRRGWRRSMRRRRGCRGVRVLLPFGPACGIDAEGLEQRPVAGVEGTGQRAQVWLVALGGHLHHDSGGDVESIGHGFDVMRAQELTMERLFAHRRGLLAQIDTAIDMGHRNRFAAGPAVSPGGRPACRNAPKAAPARLAPLAACHEPRCCPHPRR